MNTSLSLDWGVLLLELYTQFQNWQTGLLHLANLKGLIRCWSGPSLSLEIESNIHPHSWPESSVEVPNWSPKITTKNNVQEEKVFYHPKQNNHLLSSNLHRAGYLQIHLAPHSQPPNHQASLVTAWIVSLRKLLAMAVGCVKTRWFHNAALKPMPRRMKNITLFPYKFNCLCWKIALDIALLDVTSTSRLTLREWPPWCSKLCRCENGVTRWGFCLQSWAENVV